jgi:Mrp family chromosome partitioning ATPase
MSKNFELMQQAEITLNMPSLSPSRTDAQAPRERGKHKTGIRVHLHSDDAVAQEESLKLVQSVFLSPGAAAPRVVVFAGVDSGNGCSAICTRTARALASQRLGTVCLVDANLRSPSLPEYFGVGNHFGLTDSLSNPGIIRDFTKVIGPDNLSLLSCGSLATESPCLLNSETMRLRVAELRKGFHFVLIDSPALNSYADGVALGQLADGLVLVLEANATRREVASKVTENLRAAQIKILAAVLNKRTYPIPRALYEVL